MLAAVIVTVALAVFTGTATATHDGSGYWFFQGGLPRPSGQYTVTHVAGCCGPWVIVRMSWQQYTHDMKFIYITWGGSWHGFWAQTAAHENEWDITTLLGQDAYRSGGCQNPPEWNWYGVWTNCHVRSMIA